MGRKQDILAGQSPEQFVGGAPHLMMAASLEDHLWLQ